MEEFGYFIATDTFENINNFYRSQAVFAILK